MARAIEVMLATAATAEGCGCWPDCDERPSAVAGGPTVVAKGSPQPTLAGGPTVVAGGPNAGPIGVAEGTADEVAGPVGIAAEAAAPIAGPAGMAKGPCAGQADVADGPVDMVEVLMWLRPC